MLKSLLISFLALLCCGCMHAMSPTASATAPPQHRGHQWVRAHPFTIMGLTRQFPKPFVPETYRGAGFDVLLAWEPSQFDELLPMAAENDLPYHVQLGKWGDKKTNTRDANEKTLGEALGEIDSEKNRAYIRKLIDNPGCIGITCNDEVSKPTALRYTRHLLKWLRKQHPDALVYSNAHPAGHSGDNLAYGTLERYVDEFAAIVDPDVLMTDIYPFGPPDGTFLGYFRLLNVIRHTALEQGMPYWVYIQSFKSSGSWTRRLPSESDLRFQIFAPLTYGFTGIVYYTYDVAIECGLIEKDGKPNRLYHAAARVNPEVANLGTALRFLTSTDIRYVPGRHKDEKGGNAIVVNPLPTDTRAWTPGAGGDSHITNIAVDSTGEEKDGLLGFFRDDRGDRYFMLTNLWRGDPSLTFTVTFAPEVKILYRLSRITGKTESVDVDHGVLRIRLPAGTGDLFKYTADPFPGGE